MQRQERLYTSEEYLALEATADFRSEYCNGHILPRAGGSRNHNRIALNLSNALDTGLDQEEYEVFMSDMRVWIPKAKLYTYPDVMVVSEPIAYLDSSNTTVTNPLIIAEVLSDSTEAYDRGKKFEFYRSLPSLQAYLLINQFRIQIEQFTRTVEDKWLLSEYADLNAVLLLGAVKFQMPLSVIYRKVER
jgi:Uma2 family endonuclease